MKLLLSLIMLGMSVFAHGEDDILRLDAVSSAVGKLLDEKQGGRGYQLNDLKELHHELAGNRPNVWAMPPWMLSEIRNAVEPARTIASELALSDNKHERFYGAVLNTYLAPTPESKDLLLRLANDKEAPTAGTALDTLFGMKWENPEIREKLTKDLEEIAKGAPPETLAYTNAGKWGLVESVPIFIKIIENSYNSSGVIDGEACEQLKHLGIEANEALPLLKKLLEIKKKETGADFREIEALEHAVLVISGSYKAPKPREEALPDSSEQSSQDAERLERRKPKATSVSDQSSEPKQSTQTRLWLIASSIAILVLALVAWLKARKPKSTH
jgi:hypothetical protein